MCFCSILLRYVTYLFQQQRTQNVNEKTGEIYIESTPEDIELAFSLITHSLLRKVDELSTSARGFYNWLNTYLQEVKHTQFTALDIRTLKQIHPRTLNRYLQELTLFNYLQIVGGNKYRGGFIYKSTDLENVLSMQNSVETSLKNTLENIKSSKSVSQTVLSNSKTQATTTKNSRTTQKPKKAKDTFVKVKKSTPKNQRNLG